APAFALWICCRSRRTVHRCLAPAACVPARIRRLVLTPPAALIPRAALPPTVASTPALALTRASAPAPWSARRRHPWRTHTRTAPGRRHAGNELTSANGVRER